MCTCPCCSIFYPFHVFILCKCHPPVLLITLCVELKAQQAFPSLRCPYEAIWNLHFSQQSWTNRGKKNKTKLLLSFSLLWLGNVCIQNHETGRPAVLPKLSHVSFFPKTPEILLDSFFLIYIRGLIGCCCVYWLKSCRIMGIIGKLFRATMLCTVKIVFFFSKICTGYTLYCQKYSGTPSDGG